MCVDQKLFYALYCQNIENAFNKEQVKPFEVQKTNAVNALRMDFKYALFYNCAWKPEKVDVSSSRKTVSSYSKRGLRENTR